MKLCCHFFLNSGLICKVSAGNENAFQTTSYLSAMASQEPLLLPLVLCFRRWAQVRLQPSNRRVLSLPLVSCEINDTFCFITSFSTLIQICVIDRAEEGGLPPYVFALMVIYFLQQRKEALLPTYLNTEVCVCSSFKHPVLFSALVLGSRFQWELI